MPPEVQPPPRLLLGATLLFWGAMSGNALMGLITALLIEGANWIRFRWDFDHAACSRAWRISMILIIIAGVLIWLDGDRYTALPKLMVWLPMLLLPLQFVQSYGLRDHIPLNSLSFFSELHRQRNRRLGLGDSVIHFNFGNPYFLTAIVASSLGRNAESWIFLPGLVILGGWLVFSRVKDRPFALAAVMLLAGVIGFGGQIGMSKLHDWATNRSYGGGYPGTDLTVSKTSIGSLGKIKQSPEMLWRLKITEGGRVPRLLRLATYNRYKHISWRMELPESITGEMEEGEDEFTNLPTRELVTGDPYYLLREETTNAELLKPLPAFRLRGAIRSEAPLPLPGDTATLQRFELDGIEANPLGTVRVFPKRAIIDGTVRWRDDAVPDSPPWPEQDLEINTLERESVGAIIAELGLRELPTTAAKVARLNAWFIDEFTYTRYLTIGRARFGKPTAISLFLTTSRRGHCEYFATAAALLLRAADVPARYCVGFAVMERDVKRGEFVIRGTHGHAWTRVWDAEKGVWFDFDPTPPNWLALETRSATESRHFADAYQRLKEDFFLWRNRPVNRLGATLVMWALGLGTLAFVGRRLWKSKLVVARDAAGHPVPPERVTPLHRLEKHARRILGPRPPGVTLPAWLRGLARHGVPPADLDEALEIHQRIRFDPTPPPASGETRLNSLAEGIAEKLRLAKPAARRS
jgi:transglutaminase-like putative cysteine protease